MLAPPESARQVKTMEISADFDSGNIQVEDASDPRHVRLSMRTDLNSLHFQWFHFRVDGMQLGAEHAFSIINAGQSAYSQAWDGYNAVASYDQQNWFRVPSRYADGELHFSLVAEQERIWFAYFEPYSRARHQQLIEQALQLPDVQLLACRRSIEGRDIELLRVRRSAQSKRKVWIIAQQHPGEHMAEWFMEGIIRRLQQPIDGDLDLLLQHAELYLVPNMNPDGSVRGHLRTNAAGQDLNRVWQTASAESSPEVFFVQQAMREFGVDLFLDVHGDEAVPYVYIAGCEGIPGFSGRLEALENEFRQRLFARGAECLASGGYQPVAAGRANLGLAGNAVGQEFDCLSLTVEMPFIDHNDNPQADTGWNGQRSMQLAQEVLAVVAQMVDHLR